MKRVSNDTIYDAHQFNDSSIKKKSISYQPGKYIACYYDEIWYIGLILESCDENQDVKVKFMHCKGLNLHWVNVNDYNVNDNSSQCWVPFTKVICEISQSSSS